MLSSSLSELAQGERPNISLKLVSSFRLLLALGPSLPAGLLACRAVACKRKNINQNKVLTIEKRFQQSEKS